MVSHRYIFLLIPSLLLSGCSDTVTTHFSTYADAKEAGAFERGWLPPDLPKTATDIIEKNNLDRNVGTGSFAFKPEETKEYIDYLRETFGASVTHDESGESVEVSRRTILWVIHLPPDGKSATYEVKSR